MGKWCAIVKSKYLETESVKPVDSESTLYLVPIISNVVSRSASTSLEWNQDLAAGK
jgi:hypothetical protein